MYTAGKQLIWGLKPNKCIHSKTKSNWKVWVNNHRGWHLVRSLNERGQPYENLRMEHFNQRSFKCKDRGERLEGKVKRESQLGWIKPHLSIPLLSTCIIAPETGNGHILQKVQVNTFHSRRKGLLILLACQLLVCKVITSCLTFEQDW